jgi:hypothetical protein
MKSSSQKGGYEIQVREPLKSAALMSESLHTNKGANVEKA